MFEGRRWVRNLNRFDKERETILTHRDLDAKAGVKYEWSIQQGTGNEDKLTERQMKELITLYRVWRDDSYNDLLNQRP